MNEVIREERGWGGHFILSHRCRFRRNTLLTFREVRIVVSTVGNLWDDEKSQMIGADRYYETMAFHAWFDDPYWDANVMREVYLEGKQRIGECERETDLEANSMHESLVNEVTSRMLKGEFSA